MSNTSTEISKYKELKKEFIGIGEVKGFHFTQISQTDRAFIYEVNTGDAKYYEVFKRHVNKRYDCVSYPRSSSFGIWAWTKMTLDIAIEKFNELNSVD